MSLDLIALTAGLPSWWPLAGAALALAAVVLLVAMLRRSTWLSGIGPQAAVALGGVAVSVHGLWGFAGETAKLPAALAVAFIAVFDAAEMALLVMLYRAADAKQGWTRELRLMHRTAWTLVAFSAAMNAVHAPNWWSRPVLAAIPALATWLIELQLRAKLHTVRPEGEGAGGRRPGPARLVALLWQHAWARLFAAFGLDAQSSSNAIARAALAQKAARRVYRHRITLESGAASARRIERRRRAAQKALDRADVATDSTQALAMARRLATLTQTDTVARLDYADPTAITRMIANLAVTPAAEAVDAEAARQRADDARQEAESARQRAEAAIAAARKEVTDLSEQREKLTQQVRDLLAQEEGARQRAEDARQAEQAARQRADSTVSALQQDAETARQQAQQQLDDIEQAITERQQALKTVVGHARDAQGRLDHLNAEVQQVTEQVEEARLLRERLSGDLAALSAGVPESAEGPVFKSQAKQEGWQHYLATLKDSGGHTEPTAAELADRFGIDSGNARNWLRDFRAARAAQLAAHQPRAAARTETIGALA